jgi:TM2 domain-containing membrane protein YozV
VPPNLPAQRTASVPTTIESGITPKQQQEPQGQGTTTGDKVATVAKAGFGALSSAGGAVARSMAERSRRKHELKLAKIQAQALADSQRPAPAQAPQPTYTPPPPQPQQSINVNVVQQINVVGGKRWSRLVAMLLSLIIPGLGQLYKGQPINGLVWFVLTGVGYVLLIIPGIFLHILCVLGAGMGDPSR